jgi:hypothetical protein
MAPRELLEECPDGLRIDPLAAAARAPPRIVELAVVEVE